MWSCEGKAPFIYLTAITLGGPPSEQRTEVERLAASGTGVMAVCDSWAQLDLHDLGFECFEDEAWYVREPGEVPAAQGVDEVTDPALLAAFEAANSDGFEAPELHELEPFGVYGKRLLEDPRIRVFVRRVDGRVASGAMACLSSDVVGVYSVATVPGFRRQGFGAAVTWAAVGAAPKLPAVLQPSPEGAALYRRMGFAPVGRYRKWLRLS